MSEIKVSEPTEDTSKRSRKFNRDYRFKGTKGGEWKYGSDLIESMMSGKRTLHDDDIQKELLDWIMTDDVNVFRNQKNDQLVYALAAKRGNRAYAAKKRETLDRVIEAVSKYEFDTPVPGLRDSRYRKTQLLLVTLTFSRTRYTAEEAWSLLRSSPIEEIEFEYGALNKFGANISSIFGSNGKLTCKEADGSGYPAPHVIILLDKPVLVKRHNDKDGKISWRLANDHVLKRVGKDDESRKRSRENVEAATLENPIWSHGTLDIKGIIKNERFGRFSNGFTYVFKYLIKTASIVRYPELAVTDNIDGLKDKSLRMMMYTHLGNKCFRTRDIVIGKAFKDRIGLLPKQKPCDVSSDDSERPEPEWKRIRTIPKWVSDRIQGLGPPITGDG